VTFYDGSLPLGIGSISNGAAQFSISTLAAGAHAITAKYGGDANFQASMSLQITENVSQAITTTTVTSSVNPSSYGQPVILTAAVQPSFGGAATGSVSFFDGAISLGSVTPTNNSAVLSVSNLSLGAHSITARYQGDANTNGSSSAAVAQTVNAAATTTTVTSSLNPSTYGTNVTLSASIKAAFGTAPSGQISFFDGTTLLGTINTATAPPQIGITYLTAGTHSITAQFTTSNTNFAGSTSAAFTQTVNQAASLITIQSSANPSTFGQSVTLTGVIQTTGNFTAANSGSVTFLDNGVSIGSVTLPGNTNFATLTTTALTTGANSITVSYTGDSNFAAGTSAAFAQAVNLEPTTTFIASSSYTPAFAQSITLTATVKPQSGTTATGTITFMDRTTALGTVQLSSNSAQLAISTLTPGSHYISAQYNGDANTATSNSGQTQVVVSPPPTTTLLTSSVNPSSMNQPMTFTATLQLTSSGTPTGTITFYAGSFSLGSATVSNGSAQYTDPGFAQVGTQSITAVYSGDANFSGSTSAPLNQVVNPGVTTTSLSAGMNPGTVGYPVTFTVGVNATYGGVPPPMGTVTIYDGSTAVGSGFLSGTVNDGVSIAVTGLAAGSHSITAKYPGAYSYAPSTSAVYTQVMNLPATTTALTTSVNPSPYGQSLTLVAAISSTNNGTETGSVTFFNGATALGTATVSNNAAQLNVSTLPVGSDSLTAKYSGDSNYAASTSTAITETVNLAATTTTVASSVNPATFGQSVIFTVTVQPSGAGTPTGTITLMDGATSIGSGSLSGSNSVQFTVGTLSGGAHSITAAYGGDANFSGNTSAALVETVNAASTATAVASSTNPASAGQTVTLTATVQPSVGTTASGNVSFLDGATSLGSVTLASNTAQLTISTLAPGAHSITAVYGGSANLAGSTSAVLVETVNQAATTTTVTSSLNPAPYGQAVTFVVTIQPSTGGNVTGAVNLLDGTTTIGVTTLVAGQHNSVSFPLTGMQGGTHTITATYAGDANYTGSTSAALTQTFTQGTTTTSIASSVNPAALGQTVTLSATIVPSVSGSAVGGTVTFFDGATAVGTAYPSNNVAQLAISSLAAGSHSITAKAAGDANFSGSTSAVLTQSVSQGATTTTVASSLNPSAFGQAVTFVASIQPPSGNSASGTVTFLDGSTSLGTATVSSNAAQITVSGLAPGSHSITASYGGNANLAGSTSGVLTQTVNKAATSTSVSSSMDPSTYGQSVTFTATVQPASGSSPTGTVTFLDGSTQLGTGNLSGGVAQFTTAGTALNAGAHSITARYAGDSNFAGSTSGVLTQTVNAAAGGTPTIDVKISADQGPAKTSVATASFFTSGANELLLAFISSDASSSGTNAKVNSVSGGGLTWTLVLRSNTQRGTAEIWRAFSATTLSGASVTATLSEKVSSSMTVMSFTGVDTSGTGGSGAIGATKSANASSGAPTAQLVTTRNGSLVIGVGDDYDNAIARTVGSGQSLVHQYLSPVGDTYWVQMENAPTMLSGTTVVINDTAPTGDRYNLAICEILATP
jgi:hypothetical protein